MNSYIFFFFFQIEYCIETAVVGKRLIYFTLIFGPFII